eukprot:337081-Chlamydomonas_euryale.AAC.1
MAARRARQQRTAAIATTAAHSGDSGIGADVCSGDIGCDVDDGGSRSRDGAAGGVSDGALLSEQPDGSFAETVKGMEPGAAA